MNITMQEIQQISTSVAKVLIEQSPAPTKKMKKNGITDKKSFTWKNQEGRGALPNIEKIKEKYKIFNDGRVWNLKKKKWVAQTTNGNGRMKVELWLDGKRYNVKVHKLVALNYIPNPTNKPQINHIDGNKLNNNVDNLEWVTHYENFIHAHKNGLMWYQK